MIAAHSSIAGPSVRSLTRDMVLGGVLLGIALIATARCLGADLEVRREGDSATVTRGDLTLVFDPAGRGFATTVRLKGRVVSGVHGSGGLFASLILPENAPRPLQPLAGKEVVAEPVVATVEAGKEDDGARVVLRGKAAFEGIGEAPFEVVVHVPPTGASMALTATLRLPPGARAARLASFGLAVPLDLEFHPTSEMNSRLDRNTAAAAILPRWGTTVPEIAWLVARQDDRSVWGPMLWTLAGVRQVTPTSMQVWEAWSPINPPFVLQHHRAHPGWMAVADGRTAIAAAMPGMSEIPPKEIYVDSRERVLRICFQSPYCRPLDLARHPGELTAGPAYVFFEEAEPETRRAEAYREGQSGPALAAIGERIQTLPATRCNFAEAARVVEPAVRRDPAPVPDDPEFASHEPGSPREIAIWVDEPTGARLDRFPVTRGIPLARGALTDAAQVGLFDARGAAAPCAARALAYWPDGSVKWLLLDFQADLEGGRGQAYRLVVGPEARPAKVVRPLRVDESDDAIAVDTGALKLSVRRQEAKFSMTIALDLNKDGGIAEEEEIIEADEGIFGCLFSHAEDSSRWRSGSWLDPGVADPGVARVTELRVEEQSPLRAVILIRADLGHERLASTIPQEHRPEVGTPVALRLHLYAGSSLVRVQHTFMFAGDVNHDFLRQLGVRLPLSESARWTARTAIDGAPLEFSGGREFGLLQENPDSCLAWRAAGEAAETAARGRFADGWIDVAGDRWGVAVGLRRMREMFPQELHFDGRGVAAHFHSPRVAPMDVRRYAFKYGDGESTSTGFGSAFGALRTHEAYWCFHRAGDEDVAIAQVGAMLHPPLPRVRPRHVAETLAVGYVAEHGASGNDEHLDAVLHHMPRMHQHNGRFWRWYGFWHYGDEIQVYDAARRRWAQDSGRYGWYNNEPLRDYNYHLAALMTGNRRIWEQAEAMSFHVIEVDVRHAEPQPLMNASADFARQVYSRSTRDGIHLCGRRHNCQHWADGYFGHRVGSPAGFRLCYYQTGDPVMREHLERLLATALKTRRSQYMAADGDEAVLWAMIMGYEMTREERFLDRIRGYTNLQVEFARKHNGLPAARANWDWASNTPGAPPEEPQDGLWIWSFGGHVGMIEVADLLGSPELDQMLRQWTLTLEGFGPDGKRRDDWANNMGASCLLAHYYRRTGDPRAVEWFARRLASFHSGIPEDAPRADLPSGAMDDTLPFYTPQDGYGWVYSTSTFWYVGVPAWQGALRARGKP